MRVPHFTHRSGPKGAASFRHRAISALLLATATLVACAQQTARPVIEPLPTWIPPGSPSVAFHPKPAPGKDIVGLASDGQRLWVSDREVGVFVLDKEWKELPSAKGIRPGPIAWDGSCLWTVLEVEGAIVALHPVSGDRLRAISIPRFAVHQPPTAVGLAWDGTSLWLLTACGLCSSFYRIEIGTDTEPQSFAPFCDPRGLAFDRNFLLNLSYNGGHLPPRLYSRRIGGDSRSVAASLTIHDVQVPEVGDEPTALVVHGDQLLVALRGRKQLVSVVLGKQIYPAPSPLRDGGVDLTVR